MSSELVSIKEKSVLAAFSSNDGLDDMVSKTRDLVNDFEHDLSTVGGRKKTASLAAKVAKLKTRLDGMGKDLTEEWKKKSKAVDSNRKKMRDALDEIKVEARKPLTEWEAEQVRLEEEEAARLAAIKAAEEFEAAHEIAILLNDKFDRDAMEEKERLDRIAAEQERERVILQKARDEKIKAEAAEAATRKAEQEKQEILRREQDAKDRAEKAERDSIAAEERAKVQAEQAIIAQKEAVRREAERVTNEAIMAKEQEAREEAARQANRRHVSKIRREVKEALMQIGLTEDYAKKVVLSISKGSIPHTKILY